MDICIESTTTFEQDLEKFSKKIQFDFIKKMNSCFELLAQDKAAFYRQTQQFDNIKINDNYDSTMYALRISETISIILTIDDDPIFERTLITLFRIVNVAEAAAAYIAVAESLYQDFSTENQEVKVHSC